MAEGPLDNYWSRPLDSLLVNLDSTADGLSTAEAQERLRRFGPNVLEARERATALRLFLNQFKSPIVLILLFATGVSAVTQGVGGRGDHPGSSCWAAPLLSFVQEYNANNAAEKLRAQVTIKATVLRDGQPQAVPAEEVVPGDVVLLSAGSLIPADGVLLEARDFYVNQAVLTGETFPVEKQPGPVAAEASLAGAHQLRLYGHQRAQRQRPRPDRADGHGDRLRPDRRAADPAPARDRVRARHPPLRLPAHRGDAGAGADRLCGQRLFPQAGPRLAALLHRPGGGADAATAAGHHQHQPVQGLAAHGRPAASSCGGWSRSRTSAAWTCCAPTRPAR